MHKVECAAIPKATSAITCVPKPRPLTPYFTFIQQVEFAKNMQAYFASAGPRVKAPPPGIQLYCDFIAKTIVFLPKPEVKDNVATRSANLVLYSVDPMHKLRPLMKIPYAQLV